MNINLQMKMLFGRLSVIVLSIGIGVILTGNMVFPSDSYAERDRVSKQSIDLLERTGKAMAEISSAVRPAIVNISTTRTIKVSGGTDPFMDDPFFRRFFGDQLRRQHQPREQKSRGLGSGVIISADGYIVTNYHVVKEADEIKVTLSDKREFTGKIVGSDPKTEICIVKIDATNLPTLAWGNSDDLEVGDLVLAVGNPYGLNQTVTMGIVSAVGRADVGIADYEDFIQTDAAINPGNSGGALVNVRGELVGINTAIYTTSGGYQGIGFAIPSNMIKTIMESLIKKGKVVRGWLGVSIQKVTADLAKQFNLSGEKGSLVSDITENGPAEKAGLRRGDVIIAYDGKKTDEPYQLRNIVASSMPGEEHTLTIVRDNAETTVKVVIGELPSEQQGDTGEYENALKGIGVQDITAEIARKLNIPSRVKGVVVTDVDEDSPASGIIVQGDIIQEINRHRISSVKDYQEIAGRTKKGDDVLFLVYRGGSSIFITLSSRR